MFLNKKIFLVAISGIFYFSAFCQPDCVILFKYRGIITSESLKIEKIGLPTTPFLIGYIKKTEDRAFAICNLKDSKFELTLASHMSSDFCTDYDSIISNVFKRRKEGYVIKIFKEQKIGPKKRNNFEILIPLDSIKFSTETVNGHKQIIIDLGKINLLPGIEFNNNINN